MNILSAVLIVVVAVLGMRLHFVSSELKASESHRKYITRHWDSRSGSTTLVDGNPLAYNLRTFDGGKNWYQVAFDENWGMTIEGLAEDIHPGLLAQIDGMEKLLNFVHENGALEPTTVDGPEAVLLRNAGFEITESDQLE